MCTVNFVRFSIINFLLEHSLQIKYAENPYPFTHTTTTCGRIMKREWNQWKASQWFRTSSFSVDAIRWLLSLHIFFGVVMTSESEYMHQLDEHMKIWYSSVSDFFSIKRDVFFPFAVVVRSLAARWVLLSHSLFVIRQNIRCFQICHFSLEFVSLLLLLWWWWLLLHGASKRLIGCVFA